MPIFNFMCCDCGNEFEDIVMKKTDIIACTNLKCGSFAVERQFTGGSSFVLKGGGWEADGYATPKKKDDQGGSSDA